jgi:hypothetical protein
VIIAYCLAPNQSDSSTIKDFDKLAREIKIFEDQGYYTFLVGDENADRKKNDEPRNSWSAAEALINAEKQADLTWLCPENDGASQTRQKKVSVGSAFSSSLVQDRCS